jgi:cysteinyl-tRNA synthetase
MRVYSTLTRSKEPFVPLTPGAVGMYVCGVTPYDLSHVGHARSAIAFDVVRRWLLARGFRVTFVKNFTDVDDKIIRRAAEEGVAAREVSERYIAEYRADMEAIGVLAGDVEPKATEHVPEMVALIESLVAGGFAYVVDGDVYFQVERFSDYGKLSGKRLDELLAGARVEVDERKRDPRDFALWKAAKPGEPSWPSPWGPGRPGWHIECSVMSVKYLGETFDIHGGGEDLIFPHHECEIAQAEAVTGKPLARYWLHNAFVNLGAEKMSKSLGNTLLIREIVKRHDPDALRLWLLSTHYRNPVEFSEERLVEAGRRLQRLVRLAHDAPPSESGEPLADDLAAFSREFEAAMDDDFNTPQALAALAGLESALVEARDRAPGSLGARGRFARGVEELVRLARTLGLLRHEIPVAGPPAEVDALVAERTAARQRRDWRRADELRAAIGDRGWVVEDTPSGPRLARKTG